jgi:hypothetical protein
MIVVLEATAGPIAGRRLEVRAGSIVRVGRTLRADYAIAEDSYLSGLHFSVECDGEQCRVRDLGSSNGTFVNGNRVTDEVVRDGDSVTAGGCSFAVRIETRAGEPEPAPAKIPTLKYARAAAAEAAPLDITLRDASALWPGFSRPQAILLSHIYKPGEPVFAILDPVRDVRIPAFLDASGEQYARVHETNPASPYLVRVPPESRLLDVLIKDGWNHGWGFFAAAACSFEQLSAHWRDLVTLRAEDGAEFTFRFWNPRVLRAIAPAMTQAEAFRFFGPVTRAVVEGEKPELAMELALSPRGVRQQALVLV